VESPIDSLELWGVPSDSRAITLRSERGLDAIEIVVAPGSSTTHVVELRRLVDVFVRPLSEWAIKKGSTAGVFVDYFDQSGVKHIYPAQFAEWRGETLIHCRLPAGVGCQPDVPTSRFGDRSPR